MKYMKGAKIVFVFDVNKGYEAMFAEKCEEIAMYQPEVRTTLDGEWTEEELREDVYDVCIETMTDSVLKKYQYRALKDSDLLKTQYMAEKILDQIDDVVELYNKEYDKHRNENKFGIVWYDEAIKSMINKLLKENLVK